MTIPTWKMIGTESGSIFQSFDERYSLGDDPAVVQPNYTSGMLIVERLWKWITMRDYFAGNFMWTGIDYLGESTWPYQGLRAPGRSTSSAIPRTRTTSTRACGPTGRCSDFSRTGTGRDAKARSFRCWPTPNCNIVELFLNGRSLGEKRIEFPAPGHVRRMEQLRRAAGASDHERPAPELGRAVRARGAASGREAAGRDRGLQRDEVRTAGAPVALRLSPDRDTLDDRRRRRRAPDVRDRGLGRNRGANGRQPGAGSR